MADIYVDSVLGQDTNDGLTSGAPIKTIAELQTKALSPGNTVYMARGSSWREKYTVQHSGTEGVPITHEAYGTGDAPEFNDLTHHIEWAYASIASAAAGGDIWYAVNAGGTIYSPYSLVIQEGDDWIGSEQNRLGNDPATQDDINSLANTQHVRKSFSDDYGQWSWYVRLDGLDPTTAAVSTYMTPVTSNGGLGTAIDINGQSDVVFDGVNVRGFCSESTIPAVWLNTCTRITYQNSRLDFNMAGMMSLSKPTFTTTTSCLITNNDCSWNVENGLYISSASQNNVISHNDVHHNYAVNQLIGDNLSIGIQGDGEPKASGNIFEYNDVHHAGTRNQQLYDWSGVSGNLYDNSISIYSGDNNIVRYNKIHHNHQGAFYSSWECNGNEFYYNEVYNNLPINNRMIFCGNVGTMTVYNNTIAYNTLEATRPADFQTDSWRFLSLESGTAGSEYKNNIVAFNTGVTETAFPVWLVDNLNPNNFNAIDGNLYFGNVSKTSAGAATDQYHDAISNDSYANFSAWKSGTVFDANGLEGDPVFVSAGTYDFRVQPTSEALNAGMDVGLSQDINGNPIGSTPTIGANEVEAVATSSNLLTDSFNTLALTLDNETVDETGDGATLTIDSNSDAGTLWSYSKTTPFTGTEAENAAEIMANGVGQVPVIGTNTRVVTGQDLLTPHYAGWVQDTDGYGSDMVLVFNMGAGESLTIPGGAGTYLFDIDWGDDTVETGLITEGAGPHTYTDAIQAQVTIKGTFPHVYFNGGGDIGKLIRILNWGDTSWLSGSGAFNGASNLIEAVTDVTNTAEIGSMYQMMLGWSTLVNPPDLRRFAVENVVSMRDSMGGWASMTTAPDLSSFRPVSATSMYGMMEGWLSMGKVDIDIDVWQIPNLLNATNMLRNSALTTACYDRTLASWGNQTLAAGAASTTIHFGETSTYTDTASHALLLAQVAGIIDGGVEP